MAFQKRFSVFFELFFASFDRSSSRILRVDGFVSSTVSTWISMISIIHLLGKELKNGQRIDIRGRESGAIRQLMWF
jgi:hypothetical protein